MIVLDATVGAQMLMNAFQSRIRPTEASIVCVTEPLFAGFFAWVFIGQGEIPRGWGWLGAALTIAANLLVAMRKERGRRDSNPQRPDRQSGTLTN